MMEAWLSASEMMASSAESSASNTPPLASKQEPKRMQSSVPAKSATVRSSSLWSVSVPQMKRTEPMP